jgi:chromosome segregation ATPase
MTDMKNKIQKALSKTATEKERLLQNLEDSRKREQEIRDAIDAELARRRELKWDLKEKDRETMHLNILQMQRQLEKKQAKVRKAEAAVLEQRRQEVHAAGRLKNARYATKKLEKVAQHAESDAVQVKKMIKKMRKKKMKLQKKLLDAR